MTDADRSRITEQNMEFSSQGLRVLAFGYKEVEEDHVLSLESENGYTFLGLIAMVDPPRTESPSVQLQMRNVRGSGRS